MAVSANLRGLADCGGLWVLSCHPLATPDLTAESRKAASPTPASIRCASACSVNAVRADAPRHVAAQAAGWATAERTRADWVCWRIVFTSKITHL